MDSQTQRQTRMEGFRGFSELFCLSLFSALFRLGRWCRSEFSELGSAFDKMAESLSLTLNDLKAERAAKKKIKLSFNPLQSPLIAVADSRALGQVMGNLLDNAIKYCQDGAEVKVEPGGAGDEVTVSVIDTGPGIDPKHSVESAPGKVSTFRFSLRKSKV